ncbi:hypothetical protein EGI22_06095 [Lacihabitans sp. LS3-19]|nr:hypothetical protein [Lacihabitans sp. LS3-19]
MLNLIWLDKTNAVSKSAKWPLRSTILPPSLRQHQSFTRNILILNIRNKRWIVMDLEMIRSLFAFICKNSDRFTFLKSNLLK